MKAECSLSVLKNMYFSLQRARWSWHAWQKHKKQSPEGIFAGPSKKLTSFFLWCFAVCTIFAREGVLEASVIIINYRTLINHKETWREGMSKNDALRAVNVATIVASVVAIAVITCVALPLGILSRSFDKQVSLIIEGVSKIVAAVCILQLSLKMPKCVVRCLCQQNEGSVGGYGFW
jgi:ABC-type Fe3+ transport system permease subunit